MNKNVLVTGGCGFIGCHVVELLVKNHPDWLIVNLDKLTYAGNVANLKDIEDQPNYKLVVGDIGDKELVSLLLRSYKIDTIVNLAAESHVDNSIGDPSIFVVTNVLGTMNLLNEARHYWDQVGYKDKLFYHISTDEVYGSLNFSDPPFTEKTPYAPHSPYSASKASSDHLVRSFHDTYGFPSIVSNCSNNYGDRQFPEKLIPHFVYNIIHGLALPVYGTGQNVRDWLSVKDHARAIETIILKGVPGETYNIGGNNELSNLDLVHSLIKITDELLGHPKSFSEPLIRIVTDRPGHDIRYAIDATKIRTKLGWSPEAKFDDELRATVKWYIDNQSWLDDIKDGTYITRNFKYRYGITSYK